MKEYLKLLKRNRWEAVLPVVTHGCSKSGFLGCAGEGFGPVWAEHSVVRSRDSDKMPLIIPS